MINFVDKKKTLPPLYITFTYYLIPNHNRANTYLSIIFLHIRELL
jgi:hypothetical protein